MSFGKVTIRNADKWFSKYIRTEAGWKCEVCGKFCGENNSIAKLEAAHYHGRRKESVRFDVENVTSCCFNCHRKFHEDTESHKNFMIKKLGQRGFDLLTLRANTPLRGSKKMQDDMVILFCKSKLNGKM